MMSDYSPTPLTLSHRADNEAIEDYVPRILARFREVAPAGFMNALHGSFGVATYFWTTYPQGFLDAYERAGMVIVDPTLRWARETPGWTDWTEFRPSDSTGIFDLADRFGMKHGIVSSVGRDAHDGSIPTTGASLGTFARHDRPFSAEEAQWLHDQLDVLHRETCPSRPLAEESRAFLQELSAVMAGREREQCEGP